MHRGNHGHWHDRLRSVGFVTATVTEIEQIPAQKVVTTKEPTDASHIVWLPPHLKGTTTAQAYILNARIEGFEVEALCGYTWIPQRDPQRFPICQACKEIYDSDPEGHGDRDRLPDA